MTEIFHHITRLKNPNGFFRIVCLAMFLFMGSIAYGQQSICLGATKTYKVDMTENSGTGTTGSSYSWKVNETTFAGTINKLTNSGNQISINWGATPIGTYTLMVTETYQGCTSTKQLSVIIREVITPEFNLKTEYCMDDNPEILPTISNNGITGSWNPSKISTINEGTTGYVFTPSGTVCATNKTINITVYGKPKISKIDFVSDNSINIISSLTSNVEYSIDGKKWQSSSLFTNLKNGTYLAYVRNLFGCGSSSNSFNVLIIPNTITPNNDGINDTWTITGLSIYKGAILNIYDRYGKIIYTQVIEDKINWNPQYLNNNLPSTTYWWTLELVDGSVKNGHITIKNRNSDY